MELTYFGHSAFQIRTGETTLLFDPFITGNPHTQEVVKAEDLNPDVILLTHAHGDHWGDTPAIAPRSGALIVANFEITQYATTKLGHERVHPMNTGGSWSFDWGRVRQTDARHSSSFPDGTYGGNPNGYLLYLEGKVLYNAGDTDRFAEMAYYAEENIDVAFLPIGDCFTMGIDESVKAAQMLKPKLVIPIHYNTFPLIEVDVSEWEDKMARAGFQTRVLKPGETLTL